MGIWSGVSHPIIIRPCHLETERQNCSQERKRLTIYSRRLLRRGIWSTSQMCDELMEPADDVIHTWRSQTDLVSSAAFFRTRSFCRLGNARDVWTRTSPSKPQMKLIGGLSCFLLGCFVVKQVPQKDHLTVDVKSSRWFSKKFEQKTHMYVFHTLSQFHQILY